MTPQQFVARAGVKLTAEYADSNPAMSSDWPGATHWKVRLTRTNPRRTMTLVYTLGPAFVGEPKASDVIGCLVSTVGIIADTFEDFCSELGYDPDSRKAEDLYKRTKAQNRRTEAFLCGARITED